jgi:hypothetical protein
MKKIFTTSVLFAVLAITATTADAKSWRINNDVTQKADFTDLNAAMSSNDVVADDTLYLDPGCNLIEDQTVTKRVTIVGPGYFRVNTPHRFASISGKLYLKAQYIKVEGVIMTKVTYLCANYITLERCKTNTIYINENWQQPAAQHATIRQCYVVDIQGPGLSYKDKAAFAKIENCIIMVNNMTPIEDIYSPTIRNCYIAYTGTNTGIYAIKNVDNATITNNIIINQCTNTQVFSGLTNSIVSNNVMSCAEDTYSAYTTNNRFLNSADESLVFALEGTNDQKYQLKADSPAKGYATDEGDCGPFGGGYPYVLNGQPAGYPYYTKAVIGTRSKDGKVNVSLNIKMQDE